VTHDQAEAISLADRIAIINKAELQQIGTIEEIWNQPSTAAVVAAVKIVEFQGETTVLTVALADQIESEVKVEISSSEKFAMGDKIWLHFASDIIHLFDGEEPLLQRRIE
jgi:ABC-type sugar transport system ATPase subunit